MSARFYLHRRGAERREKRLRLIVYRGGRQVPVMVPVTVKASSWSQRMQRVKSSTPGATELNAELDRLRNEAEALSLRYPNDDELRAALLERVGRAPTDEERTVLELFEAFLDYKEKRVKPSTLTVFRTLGEHLKFFLEKRPGGRKVKAGGIGRGFAEDFQSFLVGEGLGNNTTNKYVRRLGTFTRWLEDRGEIEKAPAAKSLKTAQSHVVRLTLDELAALRAVDLSDEQPGFEAARDLFLLCCYTGQRISDVRRMEWRDIQADVWYMHEQKTNVVRRIPLPAPALEIIERHRGDRRPVPKLSDQRANEYLKIVAELAGITAPVTTRSQRGGRVEEETVPKCEALSLHAGRRTFVSLLLENGLSTKELLGVTHADLRSLRQYAGASEDHLRTAMTKVFESEARAT